MAHDTASGESHRCDLCHKNYERRDLLLRHRRRCQKRAARPRSRQKACNACVQAKTKCSYVQPTCARCDDRGITCRYISTNDGSQGEVSASGSDRAKSLSLPESQNGKPASNETNSPSAEPGENFEIPATWSLQMSPWPLNDLDLSLPTALLSTDAEASIYSTSQRNDLSPGFSLNTAFPLSANPTEKNYASPGSLNFTSGPSPSSADPSFLEGNSGSGQMPPSPLVNAQKLIQIVRTYPKLLMADGFRSPFAHLRLFDEEISDITTLPKTAMAVVCGAAIKEKEGGQFIKRTIDTERRRLIEAYPTYGCMQQWDALHAMLLYEILELQETPDNMLDSWKEKPRVSGLKSPFVVKMARCFLQTRIRAFDIDVDGLFRSQSSQPPLSNSSWAKWTVAESTRRTIFLANLLNCFGNRDPITGGLSAYYEPLEDACVLNMPLPCSDDLWNAKTEADWRRLVQEIEESQTFGSASAHTDTTMAHTNSLEAGENCLKSLLSKYNREELQKRYGQTAGLGDSHQLRSLLILCALEQFG